MLLTYSQNTLSKELRLFESSNELQRFEHPPTKLGVYFPKDLHTSIVRRKLWLNLFSKCRELLFAVKTHRFHMKLNFMQTPLQTFLEIKNICNLCAINLRKVPPQA